MTSVEMDDASQTLAAASEEPHQGPSAATLHSLLGLGDWRETSVSDASVLFLLIAARVMPGAQSEYENQGPGRAQAGSD
jgi:hypothetical protein